MQDSATLVYGTDGSLKLITGSQFNADPINPLYFYLGDRSFAIKGAAITHLLFCVYLDTHKEFESQLLRQNKTKWQCSEESEDLLARQQAGSITKTEFIAVLQLLKENQGYTNIVSYPQESELLV